MKKLILTALVLLTFGISSSALAGTATDNMLISLQVFGSCTVSTADMTFPAVSRMDAAVTDATADITVDCTAGTIYYVALDAGLNADPITRFLQGPAANTISYALFDGANPWGNDDAYGARVSATSAGGPEILTVTGSVTGWANQPNGTYTDTVTVTVEY